MLKKLAMFGMTAAMAAGLCARHRDAGVPAVAPDAAWHMLVLGNDRFADGLSVRPHLTAERRRALALKQRPWAVVVTGSDSRMAPEFIFDLGLGDLYVVRDAAGIMAPGPLDDSVAYATGRLGVRLVVVLGHTGSGVVTDSLSGRAKGAAARLSADIAPALQQAAAPVGNLSGEALRSEAVERNVLFEMKRLLQTSPSVAAAVRKGRVKVIGGVYDLGTGRVHWLGEHPQQAAILAGKLP